jgi:hypothetical protein
MNVAHRGYCSDFPAPTTPFQSSPFYGKYSKQGAPGDSSAYKYSPYLYNGGTQPQTDQKQKKKGGNDSYDPRLYEAPPQPAPQTTTPAPAPTTPGNGNGNGQGNGNAPPGTTGGGAAPPGTTGQTQG